MIDELKRAGHMPGDAQLVRLLILGAVNWTGTWYRTGGRLSLDEIAEGAARIVPARQKLKARVFLRIPPVQCR